MTALAATACGKGGSAEATCGEPIAQVCGQDPGNCPTSAEQGAFCKWLVSQGRYLFGGPVQCTDGRSGWEVDEPDGGMRWYLFDDAGLTTIVNLGPLGAGAPACLADCENFIVAVECVVDAGAQ
jgi:hypothetical protein